MPALRRPLGSRHPPLWSSRLATVRALVERSVHDPRALGALLPAGGRIHLRTGEPGDTGVTAAYLTGASDAGTSVTQQLAAAR